MLVATGNANDKHYKASVELLSSYDGELVVPMLVITEVAYFLGKLGPQTEKRFLDDLAAGAFRVEPVLDSDWQRIGELVVKYGDWPLGTVDASIVATAERLGIHEVATIDHKHFLAIRPTHVQGFSVLP
ncbi:type II toxin-antitoxin system VapC family toxin [Mycolicibacterium psychrotolerans]|uniref:type II toxin-antitoxin system VapC family toxin n=1 Tax=Mycolicibacterium psychrotolerans TaxID=216929 RepID=UPI003D665035